MRGLLQEFKSFALRGNVLDLAIAVILGLAFNLIVQSAVNDILMNIVAAIFGQPDFSGLTFQLGDGTIFYGRFINAVINFVLVAFALFLVVKAYNKATRKGAAPPETRECPYCLTVIPVTATRCSACTSQVEAVPAT